MGAAGPLSKMLAALAAVFATAAAADPAAWRITSRSGGEVALLGSMHVLRAADHPLPASVDALYDGADTLVLELDLDDIDAMQQQTTLLGAAVLPQGTVLRDVLDAEVYRLAEQRSSELGIDLTLLQRFEPWLVAITMLDQGIRRLGFEAERGIEQYMTAKARRDGKEIVGLESLETQVGIFDGLTPKEQQSMLEQTLQELSLADRTMADMALAWREGRLDELAADLLGDFDDFPGLYPTLVTNRNRNWVTEIERMLDDGGRYLVVVGALHLVGEDSVIELLEERGHDVVRIDDRSR
jgi:uncharacterized protein YbaP (TraB family)